MNYESRENDDPFIRGDAFGIDKKQEVCYFSERDGIQAKRKCWAGYWGRAAQPGDSVGLEILV